jgi:hypothetical protein
MLNEPDSTNTTAPETDAQDAQRKTAEKLNRIADKAAGRPGITQQRYDRDHGIFTK